MTHAGPLDSRPARLFVLLASFLAVNAMIAEFVGVKIFALEDTLIRLFPGQFWIDAGLVIAALVLITAVVTLILTWPTRRRRGLAPARKGRKGDAGDGGVKDDADDAPETGSNTARPVNL